MRSLALALATATGLAAGAASTAGASPNGLTLPNAAAAQAEQVHWRGNCYRHRGHWHCDRGRHYGWHRERPYHHWRHYRYYRDRY
jgi:hypothetical protein